MIGLQIENLIPLLKFSSSSPAKKVSGSVKTIAHKTTDADHVMQYEEVSCFFRKGFEISNHFSNKAEV